MSDLRVVALLVGDPHAPELWTLRRIASLPVRLHVVQAEGGSGVSTGRRLKYLIRHQGLLSTISRVLAGRLIGHWRERAMRRDLGRLFDEPWLLAWWSRSGIEPIVVPHLNHDHAQSAIRSLRPDVIVRVSGGVLKRRIFGEARLAALNIHHGMAPGIRGIWSIPWGIVEGRPDWIGATVHEIDDGIDTGRVFWRGAPQIAPGDTATTLFFRAHLEAVDALAEAIRVLAAGHSFPTVPAGLGETSTYRTAPGLAAWIRFLSLREGRASPAILRRALECD